jgi:hypothetical protein
LDRLLPDRMTAADGNLSLSLKTLGLWAPDGLQCAEGGTHAILEPELQVAVADALTDGMADVKCQKCGQPVDLRPLREL